MARLQKGDFDIGREVMRVAAGDGGTGGVVTFLGTARDFSRGEKVSRLEFESYADMAESELIRLEKEAMKKFDILDCAVIHRVGEIRPGENIVLIVVAAAHRAAAFDACEWMIDELKRRVPIWKKEFTASGGRWVESHP